MDLGMDVNRLKREHTAQILVIAELQEEIRKLKLTQCACEPGVTPTPWAFTAMSNANERKREKLAKIKAIIDEL
jgi:hypothetical protein